MSKNIAKRLLSLGLCGAMTVSVITSSELVAAKKPKLSNTSVTVTKGKTKTVSIKNVTAKKVKSLKWATKNKKVATVKKASSVKAKIKGVKKGTTTVTAKFQYGGKKYSLKTKVVVKNPSEVKNDEVPTEAPATSAPAQETAAPTSTPTPAVDPSVVYENHFEDGVLNGITARGGKLEVSNSQNHAEGGMNALTVTGRTETGHGAQLEISSYVKVGLAYDISMWVKQDTGSAQKISLKLQYTDGNGITRYDTVVPSGADGVSVESGKWTELKGKITMPTTQDGSIILYTEMNSSKTDSYYLDDLTIVGQEISSTKYLPTGDEYTKMLTNSLLSTGNNARIKNVIESAKKGDKVSLAYIGGSITEGGVASPNSKCYAEVSAKAFAAKYGKDGGANVQFINAGMSGTPSDIGVVRYQRDVVDRLNTGKDHPDVLFVEFAVNDYECESRGAAYEGLIRQALKSGSAVVLIFSIFQSGRVYEPNYKPVGQKYDLPMISMGDSIEKLFKTKGFLKWYFGDSLHPNNTGHQLMSDCIMKLFDTMDKETAEKDNITDVDSIKPQKENAEKYTGIQMIDSESKAGDNPAILSIDAGSFTSKDASMATFGYEYKGQKGVTWFPNNFMHATGTEPLSMELQCKLFTIVYKQSSETSFGKADVYIDGKKEKTLSCYNSSGWNNGSVYIGIVNDTVEKHTISIKMADGDENKKFTIYAIGYN